MFKFFANVCGQLDVRFYSVKIVYYQSFLAYKEYKENHIKQIADEYFSNGYITEQVYNAMYAWEIEPTD